VHSEWLTAILIVAGERAVMHGAGTADVAARGEAASAKA